MKIFIKLLLLLVVLAIAGLFFIKKPDGTPWLSVSDLTSKTTNVLKPIAPSTKSEQVYRWQDEKGNWHFSDKPVDGVQQDQITVKQSQNRLKQVDLPEGFGEQKKDQDKTFDPTDNEGSGFPLTTAPLEKVPEMLDKIEDVQKKMDNRQKALDALQ